MCNTISKVCKLCFFSHDAICICQLQFSSYAFFSPLALSYLLLMPLLMVWCGVWCFAGAVQLFIANFLIYFSHAFTQYCHYYTFQLSILSSTHRHTLAHKHRHNKPLRDTDSLESIESHRIFYNGICDLIEPECENLRMNGECVCVLHAILLCINTTCTAIIIK